MDRSGVLEIVRIADGFGMSKTQLASTAGLSRESLYKIHAQPLIQDPDAARRRCSRSSVELQTGQAGRQQAMSWYRAQPIPAFGGRTAEALVKEGRAADVRDYLDHVASRRFCLRFVGTCYRAHDPRWSFKPISGDGAAIRGARFNPKGVPALYLALSVITAVKEANQGLAQRINPCVLCSYDRRLRRHRRSARR